jgi:hypothetical protein
MRNMSFGRCVGAVVGVVICGVLLIGSRDAVAGTGDTISLSTSSVNVGTGQVININISGSTQVAGTTWDVQVLDGGSGNSGTATKPTITGMEVTTGISSANNTGNAFIQPNGPLIGSASTTTTSGTVLDSGVLAKLTLNTTGMSSGNTFTIQFTNVGPSHATSEVDSLSGPITLTGAGIGSTATITVVPEPMSASLMLLGIGGLALRRSRR